LNTRLRTWLVFEVVVLMIMQYNHTVEDRRKRWWNIYSWESFGIGKLEYR